MAFWDQVKRGVTKAAGEAEKQATIARLSLEMNGVKNDIKHKTEDLGAVTLQLQRTGELSHASFDPIVQDIAALETRIADLEKQIEELRAPPPSEKVRPPEKGPPLPGTSK